jgi:hypothetical protein
MSDNYDPGALERFVRRSVDAFGGTRPAYDATNEDIDAYEAGVDGQQDHAGGEPADELDEDEDEQYELYEDDELDEDDQPIQNGADLVGAIVNEGWAQQVFEGQVDDIDVLLWMATTSAAEWANWCAASGHPVEIRPGWGDLPPSLQVQMTSDRLDARREAIERGDADYIR